MTSSPWRSMIRVATGVGFASCCWTLAAAQTPTTDDAIADNGSIFVDGTKFKVVPGRAVRDVTGLITKLDAKEMGPASLIFRSGEKLYIVNTPLPADDPADEARSNRIRVEYVPPTNPDHQNIYNMVKGDHALETVQQIFAPFRLPVDLTIRTVGCDGASNAWYQREGLHPLVSLCYEYLDEIRQKMPKETTPAGTTPREAVIGQFFYAVSHEIGHAMFDIFDVPVFGREEDAADQFAAYVMVQFRKDEARKFITGAAHSYYEFIKADKAKPNVTVPLRDFSSNHGTPEERFYNLLCIAYGADATLFADLVEKDYLPKTRAKSCKYEYQVLAYAVHHEISPHIDQRMARSVLNMTWFAQALVQPAAK
jgi:Putative metallopeptidase